MSKLQQHIVLASVAAIALALATWGCDGSANPVAGGHEAASLAGAAQTETDAFKFVFDPFRVLNPCTGEELEISGRGQLIIHTTINRGECDPECGFHFKFQTHLIAEAVGLTTGETFITRGPLNLTFNSPDPFDFSPSNGVFVSQGFNFISPGPGDNFIAHVNGQLVINANDEVTAEFTHAFAECVG